LDNCLPAVPQDASREEIGSTEGLAALSLDALSSVAYGPEAIALVLIGGGGGIGACIICCALRWPLSGC